MKVKLRDVSNIIMGQSPDSSTYNTEKIGLPFFQGNADFGELNPIAKTWCSAPIKIAYKNYILISVRAPIGALNIAAETCCIGRGLAAFDVNNKMCTQKYLWYLLKAKKNELLSKGTGSTFKAISKNILSEMEFNIPPVREQELCTKVLDVVFCLIRLKKEQLDKLDLLVKSRFVEMFGELKSNSKKWVIEPFDYFATIDGNMTTDFVKYANYPHIGIDSIEKNSGILKGYKTVKEDGVKSGKYIFNEEHIIYSKIRPNLNKVALPDFEGLCSADAYPILVKKDVCNRIYLVYVMRSSYFLDYILAFSSRTNMPKVNRAQVKGFSMPLPPLQLQNQFASFVQQVDKSKLAIQQSLDELETLKKSLMQQYFG